MHVEKIKVRGLKGAQVEQSFGKLNLIQGRNGTGKTRLLDAMLFAFGQPSRGMSPEGRNIAAAMAGDEISSTVTIVEGDSTVSVERSRRRNRGAFGRSKLFRDGQEIDSIEQILGQFNPNKGRAMVDMSPDALLSAVSQIGAKCCDDAGPLLDALEKAAKSYSKAWTPARGSALERLEVAVSKIAEWKKAQRKAVREAEASREYSRKQLGAARVQPGLAEAKAKAVESASQGEKEASERVGQGRAEVASLGRQIAEINTKLISAGSGGEDLASATAEIARLEPECAAADKVHLDAHRVKEERSSAHEEIETKIRGYEDAIAELESELSSRQAQAKHLSSAPCSRAKEWISVVDQAEDPFADPEDLCATCPFPAEARKAAEGIPSLEEKITKLKAELDASIEPWKKAAKARGAAVEACEKAQALAEEFHRKLDSARRAEAESRKSSGISEEMKAEWQQALHRLEGEKGRVDGELRRACADLESCSAARATASREQREAEINEERLRRLRHDEKRATDAEGWLKVVEKLDSHAKRVARALAKAGEARIIELGSPLVVDPCELAFDDGRVGLRGPDGSFWTGAGLSDAQRELLFGALDFAQSVIDGDRFRIAMVEADPIDLEARAMLLAQLEAAVERGELSQVFVCSWLPIEAGDAWSRIVVEGHVENDDPFAEPDGEHVADDDEDPFAAPAYVAKIEEGTGPELTAWLTKLKEFRPGAFQKLPRKLLDRKRLLAELAAELDDDERTEIFEC